jgi:aminoglycoside phosphotransferase (APT) family kinase protein
LSDALLQSLLAIRKACVQMKPDLTLQQRARIDLMTTVLAKLIFDTRDLPAMALQRQQQCAASGVDAASMKTRVEIETAFAVAREAAIRAEIDRGELLSDTDDPQNEVFDKAAFRHYLIDTLAEDAAVEVADVRLASRGFSKKTILVTLRNSHVLPSELALRVDRPFNFLGTTVIDEFTPLVALHSTGIRLPKPYAIEPTGKVLDGPFIIFEKKSGGLVGNNFQSPARNPALASDVARCLAQVHRTPMALLPGLRGTSRSSIEQARSEIDKSKADWSALNRFEPLMDAAFEWLYANVASAEGERGVVHGDYNFNNLLIDADRVSAIVDWEFLHIGNPAADLGWFRYGAEGICGWQEFLNHYENAGGFKLSPRQLDFFYLLGQTRLGVMTLQTESGFNEGRFDDVKFGQSGALYTNKSLIRIGTILQSLL